MEETEKQDRSENLRKLSHKDDKKERVEEVNKKKKEERERKRSPCLLRRMIVGTAFLENPGRCNPPRRGENK